MLYHLVFGALNYQKRKRGILKANYLHSFLKYSIPNIFISHFSIKIRSLQQLSYRRVRGDSANSSQAD